MLAIDPREITPEPVYLNRRRFMRVMSAAALASLLAACGVPAANSPSAGQAALDPTVAAAGMLADELGAAATGYDSATGYINYYEFSFAKEGVGRLSASLPTSPWTVAVGGLVANPLTLAVSDLRDLGEEQRVYRLRCVEAWSMVIPWLGVPLQRVLALAKPTAEARYVRFETLYAPEQMPNQGGVAGRDYPWPYVEGLRLDEAQHDLTLLATGMYGKALLPQNGAPVRLVVPWKYGFKSIKAVVKIDLVAEMPTSFWMQLAPNEYGFYANVNPAVAHPRWSQATERRIGGLGRRETLLYNGYDEVAKLYEGMDLRENF